MLRAEFSLQAARFLRNAPRDVAVRVMRKVDGLREDPFPSDVKRVINAPGKVFRIRIGDYRIQYMLIYERGILFVTAIDKRSRVYDG